jgi:predicted membrane channel-forming protein YqfA (hemolysin III family)
MKLFKNEILYSEGRLRPYFRGKHHLISCITIFPLFLYLFCKSYNGTNKYQFIVCIINFIILYLAHIISAFYHIVDLSIKNEIIIQKIDIIGANWYITSSYFPMALLLFPAKAGITLVVCAISICLWNNYDIIYSNYSITRPLYIVSLQVPFMYYIINYLTLYEIKCFFTGIILLFIASIFLIYEICPHMFNKNIFGNFEIYHSISVICVLLILLMNYNIYLRTSNLE